MLALSIIAIILIGLLLAALRALHLARGQLRRQQALATSQNIEKRIDRAQPESQLTWQSSSSWPWPELSYQAALGQKRLDLLMQHGEAMSASQRQGELIKAAEFFEPLTLVAAITAFLEPGQPLPGHEKLDLVEYLNELFSERDLSAFQLAAQEPAMQVFVNTEREGLALLLRGLRRLVTLPITEPLTWKISLEPDSVRLQGWGGFQESAWQPSEGVESGPCFYPCLIDHLRELAQRIGARLVMDGRDLDATTVQVIWSRFSGKMPAMADKQIDHPAPMSILCIDDSTDTHQLIRVFLSSRPWDYHAALSAEEGLELVKQQPVHLVLVDLNMPGMDGLQAIRMIRQLEHDLSRDSALILLFTASDAVAELQEAKAAGCDGFLPKPVTKDSLLQALDFHLGAIKT